MKSWINALFIIAIVAAGFMFEIASWRECLTTNSWWYCMRVLSH